MKSFKDPNNTDKDYVRTFSEKINTQDYDSEAVMVKYHLYHNGNENNCYWGNIEIEAICYGSHSTSLRAAAGIEQLKEAIEKIFQEQLRYRTKPNDNS